MKKSSLFTVILGGLCAALWSFKAVCVLVSKPYPTNSFLMILDVLCALIWIAAFVVQLIRYKNSDKKAKGRMKE